MPAGTVPVSGDTTVTSFKAILGGRKPLLVLSNSRSELASMVFGLFPILTWALTERVLVSINKTHANAMIGFFMRMDGFYNKIFPPFFETKLYIKKYRNLYRTA
jgi:hypothetical protein